MHKITLTFVPFTEKRKITKTCTITLETVATFVADKATLGIKSPSFVEVTSNAPTGETVPIPTWAIQLLFPKKEIIKVKKNDFKVKFII